MEAKYIIKEMRASMGLSQSKFSEYFGIPIRTIQDWEHGKRTPPEYVPRLMQYKIDHDAEEKENK